MPFSFGRHFIISKPLLPESSEKAPAHVGNYPAVLTIDIKTNYTQRLQKVRIIKIIWLSPKLKLSTVFLVPAFERMKA
jgi:hypothetical protein